VVDRVSRSQRRVAYKGCAYYIQDPSTVDGSREPYGVGIQMEHILFFVNGAYASLQ